jgi:hypothetical protein
LRRENDVHLAGSKPRPKLSVPVHLPPDPNACLGDHVLNVKIDGNVSVLFRSNNLGILGTIPFAGRPVGGYSGDQHLS